MQIKFTSYVDYCLNLSWKNIYFFSCKNSCVKSEKFWYVKKWNSWKIKQKTQNFAVWKVKNYKKL